MEEKERYIIDRFDEDIFDTKKEYYPSNQTICEIINQQDKRTKELEEENKELEIKLDKCVTELVNAESLVSYLENENQKLKQQLHDLPKKIMGDIQENFDWRQCCEIRKYYDQQYIWFNYIVFNDFLHTILNKCGDVEK